MPKRCFAAAVASLALGLALCALPVQARADNAAEKKDAQISAVEATQVPVVLMSHWKASTQAEKNAFLMGFATMLELEKEWQGKHPLPFKQSLVSSWVKGLDGVTFGQMSDTLDKYAADNPTDNERPVVEVLWFHYAQPKMKDPISALKK